MMKEVLIYCTQGCPWCIEAKKYFADRGIPFRDIDVTRDGQRKDEMFKRSGKLTVPQIWIDRQLIVGFNKKKLDSIIMTHE